MAQPFAALPMYDWPEVSGAWDDLWRLARERLHAQGMNVAPTLRRDGDHEAPWTDPALIIGQTCGWPFVCTLREKVAPFARFDFGLGGSPGDYHSIYITQGEADPSQLIADANAGIAVNSFSSQSGFRALSELADSPVALPASRFLVTGGHRSSIKAVAEGRAQLAAIDAQTWRLAMAHEPAARKVHVSGHSSNVPGLPLITAPAFTGLAPDLFEVLKIAVDTLPAAKRNALGMVGMVEAVAGDYAVLTQLPFGTVSVIP